MRTLNLVDLFCGAGGAAMGLHHGLDDLGIPHEIYGVDIVPQKRYPFHFVLGDALRPPFDLREFDFIWASPKCQRYTRLTEKKYRGNHQDQIPSVRAMLKRAGVPYTIENVEDAREVLENPFTLCGSMFGLRVWRHRCFESFPPIFTLVPPCDHSFAPVLLSGSPRRNGNRTEPSTQARRDAVGIQWMSRLELDQAIPPAYSRYIIKQIFGNG